jgi:hypothetical protein
MMRVIICIVIVFGVASIDDRLEKLIEIQTSILHAMERSR